MRKKLDPGTDQEQYVVVFSAFIVLFNLTNKGPIAKTRKVWCQIYDILKITINVKLNKTPDQSHSRCITTYRGRVHSESWLLEHVGLVLMGPWTLNKTLLWLLSAGISSSGVLRKPPRWKRYRLNWGFRITYTVCGTQFAHIPHQLRKTKQTVSSPTLDDHVQVLLVLPRPPQIQDQSIFTSQ